MSEAKTTSLSAGVSVTVCPPGPESPELRFQQYQFDNEFGSTASRSLAPAAMRLVSRDPTIGREIHDIAEFAKRRLQMSDDDKVEEIIEVLEKSDEITLPNL